MNWSLWTRRFIFIIVIIIAIYDLAAATFGSQGSTISLQLWYMTGANWKAASLAFGLGYIMGHMLGRVDK